MHSKIKHKVNITFIQQRLIVIITSRYKNKMPPHNVTASSSNSLFSASRESSQQNLGLTVLIFLFVFFCVCGHVLFQFLCSLQQYCDSAYNKLNSRQQKEFINITKMNYIGEKIGAREGDKHLCTHARTHTSSPLLHLWDEMTNIFMNHMQGQRVCL